MNEKLQTIADHVFLIPGDSHSKICSNVYVLEGPNSFALIDSGVESARVLEAVKPLDTPIQTVFFTHGHFDHVQAALKAGWNGQMASNDLDVIHELNAAWFNVQKPDFFKPFDVKTLRFAEFKLQIIPTPGHTPGSVSFLDNEGGILFSGDTQFANGGVGRTDFWGGNADELEKSLEKIDQLDYRILAPGHGPMESNQKMPL